MQEQERLLNLVKNLLGINKMNMKNHRLGKKILPNLFYGNKGNGNFINVNENRENKEEGESYDKGYFMGY